jgi:ribosomal protein L24
MVKLYTSLLSFTLTTSLALALPYAHGFDYSDVLERDLDEEFSGREYLVDAPDDLAAREPNLFDVVSNVGKVASKGLEVADKVANNPIVQAAVPLIPGGSGVLAAEKVISAIGKFQKIEKAVSKAGKVMSTAGKVASTAKKVEGALKKGVNAIKKEEQSNRKPKHLGSALKAAKKINKVVKQAKQARQTISSRSKSSRQSAKAAKPGKRHHRRDLEDDEELSRRDLDAEEFFGREYDAFLAERDFFDDLD